MAKQLGHRSPLGLFRPLGLSSVGQRRFLGAPSLSFLDLKTFYPAGFPAVVPVQPSSDSQLDGIQTDGTQADDNRTPPQLASYPSIADIAAQSDAVSQPFITDSVPQANSPVQRSAQADLDQLANAGANADPASLLETKLGADSCDRNALVPDPTNPPAPIQAQSFRTNLQTYFMAHSQPPLTPPTSFQSNPAAAENLPSSLAETEQRQASREFAPDNVPLDNSGQATQGSQNLQQSASTPQPLQQTPSVQPSSQPETETKPLPLVQRQPLESDHSKQFDQHEPSPLENNQPAITQQQAGIPSVGQPSVGQSQASGHPPTVSQADTVTSFTETDQIQPSVAKNITSPSSRSLAADAEPAVPIQRQADSQADPLQPPDSVSQLQTGQDSSHHPATDTPSINRATTIDPVSTDAADVSGRLVPVSESSAVQSNHPIAQDAPSDKIANPAQLSADDIVEHDPSPVGASSESAEIGHPTAQLQAPLPETVHTTTEASHSPVNHPLQLAGPVESHGSSEPEHTPQPIAEETPGADASSTINQSPQPLPQPPSVQPPSQPETEPKHLPLIQRQPLQSDHSQPFDQREPSPLANNQPAITQQQAGISSVEQPSVRQSSVGQSQASGHPPTISQADTVRSVTETDLIQPPVAENITSPSSHSLAADAEQAAPIQRQADNNSQTDPLQSPDSVSQLQTGQDSDCNPATDTPSINRATTIAPVSTDSADISGSLAAPLSESSAIQDAPSDRTIPLQPAKEQTLSADIASAQSQLQSSPNPETEIANPAQLSSADIVEHDPSPVGASSESAETGHTTAQLQSPLTETVHTSSASTIASHHASPPESDEIVTEAVHSSSHRLIEQPLQAKPDASADIEQPLQAKPDASADTELDQAIVPLLAVSDSAETSIQHQSQVSSPLIDETSASTIVNDQSPSPKSNEILPETASLSPSHSIEPAMQPFEQTAQLEASTAAESDEVMAASINATDAVTEPIQQKSEAGISPLVEANAAHSMDSEAQPTKAPASSPIDHALDTHSGESVNKTTTRQPTPSPLTDRLSIQRATSKGNMADPSQPDESGVPGTSNSSSVEKTVPISLSPVEPESSAPISVEPESSMPTSAVQLSSAAAETAAEISSASFDVQGEAAFNHETSLLPAESAIAIPPLIQRSEPSFQPVSENTGLVQSSQVEQSSQAKNIIQSKQNEAPSSTVENPPLLTSIPSVSTLQAQSGGQPFKAIPHQSAAPSSSVSETHGLNQSEASPVDIGQLMPLPTALKPLGVLRPLQSIVRPRENIKMPSAGLERSQVAETADIQPSAMFKKTSQLASSNNLSMVQRRGDDSQNDGPQSVVQPDVRSLSAPATHLPHQKSDEASNLVQQSQDSSVSALSSADGPTVTSPVIPWQSSPRVTHGAGGDVGQSGDVGQIRQLKVLRPIGVLRPLPFLELRSQPKQPKQPNRVPSPADPVSSSPQLLPNRSQIHTLQPKAHPQGNDEGTLSAWSNLESLVTQLTPTSSHGQAFHQSPDQVSAQTPDTSSIQLPDSHTTQQKMIDQASAQLAGPALPNGWSNIEDLVAHLQPMSDTETSAKESNSQVSSNSSNTANISNDGGLQMSKATVSNSTSKNSIVPEPRVDPPTVSVQRKLDASSTPLSPLSPAHVIQTKQEPPTVTICRASNTNQEEKSHDIQNYSQHLELLAHEVYSLLRQRLCLEQERRGPKYPR